MSHNINITNGRASIAMAKTSAWHRLGQILPDVFTAEEAIREANMGWDVNLESVHTADGRVIPTHKATVRSDTKAVLGVVGNRYTPVQNRDAFGFFDGVFGAGNARFESAGVLGQGERVWMLASLPGGFDVLPGDSISKYLLLTNSHDGSSPVTAIFTPIRVVCQNTLGMALRTADKDAMVRVLHTPSADARLAIAGQLLGKAGIFFDEAGQRFTTLARKQVTSQALRSYFARVATDSPAPKWEDMSTRSKNVVLQLESLHETGVGVDIRGVRGTLWGAYNAVTEYVDHVRFAGREDGETLGYIGLQGGARMKGRALEVAMEDALAISN